MSKDRNGFYILIYLLLWITGVIAYFTKGKNDKRVKHHAIQAILFGIFSAIISVVLTIASLGFISFITSVLIWIYGMYIGYEAYVGKDVNIPYISNYAEVHSDYKLETESKTEKKSKTNTQSKEKSSKSYDADSLKALRMRYVNGKISKKEYSEMKKELESE